MALSALTGVAAINDAVAPKKVLRSMNSPVLLRAPCPHTRAGRSEPSTFLRPACGWDARLMQIDFCPPPIAGLRDIERIGTAAVDGIDAAELLRTLAGMAKPANHCAVQLQFIDFPAMIDVVLRI